MRGKNVLNTLSVFFETQETNLLFVFCDSSLGSTPSTAQVEHGSKKVSFASWGLLHDPQHHSCPSRPQCGVSSYSGIGVDPTHYQCPTNWASVRAGVLTTTGASSNYVIDLSIPTDEAIDPCPSLCYRARPHKVTMLDD
eukprot:SAG22_NODE_695_length_7843_cov_2.924587_6_plen_139_part_00